jgi:hypothetical protein
MQPPNYSARCLGGARFAFVVNERLRLIGYTSCCAARRAPSARRRTARTRGARGPRSCAAVYGSCTGCEEEKLSGQFSKNQLKKKWEARCNVCVGA